ncbi:MAG: FecR domain-containing protein [Gemmatimonadota bacterium]
MPNSTRPEDQPTEPDWDALARLLSGDGTADEIAAAERDLRANAEHAAFIDVLSDAVRRPDPAPPTDAEVNVALARVLARSAALGTTASAPVPTPVVSLDAFSSRWGGARLRAAAAILVVVGAGVVWRAAQGPTPAGAPQLAQTHFSTAVGGLDSLNLPDGTRVLLGPGSDLTLAGGFGGSSRELTLRGEARFNVRHDEAHPFVVHTAAATFRDVGTVFAIHSDSADGSRIVVTEGAVAVQGAAGRESVTLGAGDKAAITSGGSLDVSRSAATSDDVAWTTGRLIFNDAPMAQVGADLKRWFGIDLRVDEKMASRKVRVAFERADAVEDVGRVLAATLGGGVRVEGTTITIVSAPTAQPPK